jgi:hypothetical protein
MVGFSGPEKNKLYWQKTTYTGLMDRAFCNHYLILFEAFSSVQGQIINVIFNVISVLLQAQEPLTSPGTNDYV